MTKHGYPKGRKAAPSGAWLAFLALAIQVLLPFIVGYEIGLAGTSVDAETSTICHVPGASTAPGPGGGEATHHGLSGCCPICQAAAAGHAFTEPAAITLAVPTISTAILRLSAPNWRPTFLPAAPYQSRAPPSSV